MASRRAIWKYATAILVAAALAITGIVAFPLLRERLLASQANVASPADAAVELIPGDSPGLLLSREVPAALGIHSAPSTSASEARTLELPGTLILDANRLSHIHARFCGEVVQVGGDPDRDERIDVNEPIRKGQLLAVLWCRDLGEKKSELVDTLSQLRVDQQTYDQVQKSSSDGAIPDRTLREAKRRLETDLIARDRVLRTLELWRVTKGEIDALYAEADRQVRTGERPHAEAINDWARFEIRAPLDGVLLERNVAKGDLVDTTLDLFKIADLTRLRVVAYAYEEDLPALDAIPENQRRWTVAVEAEGGESLSGGFDRISKIIDPNQHTALVMGWVDNKGGRYRIGQFVTVTVELPSAKGEVALPATALIDEGRQQIVFVQPDGKAPRYFPRRIAVSRRTAATLFVRNQLSSAERARGFLPLKPGELVVSSGAVQLFDTLKRLQSTIVAK